MNKIIFFLFLLIIASCKKENITRFSARKILTKKGYDFIFPCMCRVDHLTMSLRGFRYERDKTIADGDDVCNNHVMGLGSTEWAPEKGFSTRR